MEETPTYQNSIGQADEKVTVEVWPPYSQHQGKRISPACPDKPEETYIIRDTVRHMQLLATDWATKPEAFYRLAAKSITDALNERATALKASSQQVAPAADYVAIEKLLTPRALATIQTSHFYPLDAAKAQIAAGDFTDRQFAIAMNVITAEHIVKDGLRQALIAALRVGGWL